MCLPSSWVTLFLSHHSLLPFYMLPILANPFIVFIFISVSCTGPSIYFMHQEFQFCTVSFIVLHILFLLPIMVSNINIWLSQHLLSTNYLTAILQDSVKYTALNKSGVVPSLTESSPLSEEVLCALLGSAVRWGSRSILTQQGREFHAGLV